MSDEIVTNEAIATGWLTTQLRGDVGLAKTYIREARRMVGQLRSIYGVNARIAAGEPGGFYRARRQLADGTLIDVVSNDGNDRISISAGAAASSGAGQSEQGEDGSSVALTDADGAAVSPQADEPGVPRGTFGEIEPQAKRTDDPFEYEIFAVAGVSFSAGQDEYPFVWDPQDQFTYIPFLPGCYYGSAEGVSFDGDSACGTMGGDDDDTAFVWTRDGGTVDLGATGMAGRLYAYSLSADGAIVAGYRWDGTEGEQACYWEDAGGGYSIALLPRIASPWSSFATAVSADGEYITGSIYEPNGYGAAEVRGVRWGRQRGGGYAIDTMLPSRGPGTMYEAAVIATAHMDLFLDGSSATVTYYEDYVYTLATNDAPGNIHVIPSSGAESDQVQNIYRAPQYPYQVVGHSTEVQPRRLTPPFSQYTFHNNLIRWYVPPELRPRGISADGAVIAGNTSDGYAFRWTEQDGLQLIVAPVSDVEPSGAFGISADATTIVGRRGDRWFSWSDPHNTGGEAVDVGAGIANAVAQAGDLAVGNSTIFRSQPGTMACIRDQPDADGSYTNTELGFGKGGLYSVANDITHIIVIRHPDGRTEYVPDLPVFF